MLEEGFTPGETGFSVMAEVVFDVDLKVDFRLDSSNSNGRIAFLAERVASENAPKCQNTRYFLEMETILCRQNTKSGGEGDGDLGAGEGRVSEKGGWARLWRLRRAEKCHLILEIMKSY